MTLSFRFIFFLRFPIYIHSSLQYLDSLLSAFTFLSLFFFFFSFLSCDVSRSLPLSYRHSRDQFRWMRSHRCFGFDKRVEKWGIIPRKNCWDYNSITCKLKKKKEEEQGRRKKKMKKKKPQTPNEGLVIVPMNAHLSLNARASDQERAMHLIPTRRQGELDFLHTFKFWPSVSQY